MRRATSPARACECALDGIVLGHDLTVIEEKTTMTTIGDTLVNHFDGIAAYCNHPVRFGVVESLNTTIKGVLRRARGIGDEAMLLLKLKWASATAIRSSRDLTQFLQPIRGIS